MTQALLRPGRRPPRPEAAGHPPGGTGDRRADIQGLRAVAVTLVVLSHAGVRQFSGGYLGVDVFFVISGFLITSMLVGELDRTGRISVPRFYARRALRLLPASTLVGVVTLVGSYLYLSKARFAEYAGDAIASGLYAVNIRLAVNGTDYLQATDPPSPFQHFWSLAVEEQFYVVWPLVLAAAYLVARRGRAARTAAAEAGAEGRTDWSTEGRTDWRTTAVPAGIAFVLLAISFVLSVHTTRTSPSWAYFGSQTRAWELAAGALLALCANRLRSMPPLLAGTLSWVGLAAVVGAALTFDDTTAFPGYAALVPVAGTVLVLAGGSVRSRFGGEMLLRQRPLTGIGGLSYGWYLWHWPLLVILPSALDRPGAGVRTRLAVCVFALFLAWLTLRFVENPIRFGAAFRNRPRRALGLGAGLTAGAVALAVLAALFPPAIDSGRPAPSLAAAVEKAADPQARLAQLLAEPNKVIPSNLSPGLTKIKAARSAVYRDGCHVSTTSVAVPPCVYGDPASDTTVVLFGDSHAAQWFPALELLARERHWRLISLTKASCKVADVTIISGGKPYTSCDTWRSKALARIAELRPDLVITSSSDAGNPAHPDPAGALQQWTKGFERTYKALGASGAEVAALLDTPWPASDAVDCAGTHPLDLGRCANTRGGAEQDPHKPAAIRAAAKATGATVIDPWPWMCGSRVCPVLVGDTFVYRDDSHMADAYAHALAPVLGAELTRRFTKL
ncbi:acyltransferase family protein [Actinacidiphila yeochonensis]|uniref:acyltransferase family protein n=1 Tax=Actinacidiphila yeochonensis TaxID=89050 RepID=UPI001E409561|nr:acyltransferase family protein [Actinacidiphila yeochonensis]